MECIKFLSAMSAKILERSPLKYSLVRFASCLAPASVLNGGTIEEQNFAGLVETLYKSNNIGATVADVAKTQYAGLCKLASTEMKHLFETFSVSNDVSYEALYKYPNNDDDDDDKDNHERTILRDN